MRRRATKRRRVSGSAFKIAKAALSGVKKLRRSFETKFHRSASSANVPQVGTGGVSFLLSGVTQGDTPVTRDGDLIKPTSLFIRYAVRRALTSTNETDYVRIVIIRNSNPNGVDPLLQSVFAPTLTVFSPLNRANADQFHVMYDKLHHLSDVGPGAVVKKKYIRLSRTTSFFGAGSTITQANKNSYHLFRFCDKADNFPVLDFNVVFNYKDP